MRADDNARGVAAQRPSPAGGGRWDRAGASFADEKEKPNAEEAMIKITSDAFQDGQPIPIKYTRDGQNVSPPLRWENVPPGTRELAIVVEDPDAPKPQPFVHWVAFKIPPNAGGLPEGVPQKPVSDKPVRIAQGENDFHDVGYDGPEPPTGDGAHRYFFEVYALDTPLEIEPQQDAQALVASMAGHIIDQGKLMGIYERQSGPGAK
jgi:Raf kinase inhibitor-like YbhB/YbcL family protein